MQSRWFLNTAEDFDLAWRFFSGLRPDAKHPAGWDFCRFEWWYYRLHALRHESDSGFFQKNLRLWLDDENRVRHAAVSEYGKGDIHILSRRGDSDTVGLVYEWVERKWPRDGQELKYMLTGDDAHAGKTLSTLGYQAKEVEGYTYLYEPSRVDTGYNLPEGYRIQSADQPGFDHGLRRVLCTNAFTHALMPEKKYFSTMKAPSYNKELDLSVLDTSGAHAAYCMGWLDKRTGYAAIEPVGTHEDHRRKGLAGSVIRECFKRLVERGADTVAIGGNESIYDKLGPGAKLPETRWIKKTGQL